MLSFIHLPNSMGWRAWRVETPRQSLHETREVNRQNSHEDHISIILLIVQFLVQPRTFPKELLFFRFLLFFVI
jgi:hypothetical protein